MVIGFALSLAIILQSQASVTRDPSLFNTEHAQKLQFTYYGIFHYNSGDLFCLANR